MEFKKIKIITLLICSFCISNSIGNAKETKQKIPVTLTCISQVATEFKIPPALILSILATEGGQVGMCNNLKIRNGVPISGDIGAMQINSSAWLSELTQYGITGYDLRDNGCLNVYVGAWILRRNIKSCDDLWTGIGRYHSSNPKFNIRYQKKIQKALKKIITDNMYVEQILRRTNKYVR